MWVRALANKVAVGVIACGAKWATLADILDPFTDEFELPHILFSDIIQSENRRIRIAEYAELSGLVLNATKEIFEKKKRVFESFLEVHKKFVVLFANWPF